MTRRALVLSSGGARGSFEVGVMEELILNRGLDFQIFCGISAGALNASVVAQARADADPATSLRNLQDEYRALRRIWLEKITGNRSIFRTRLLGIIGIALGADSVYDTSALESLLQQSVSAEKLANSGRTLGVKYAVLETGDVVAVGAGRDIVKSVLASASVPVLFPPVVLDGQHRVDGGVRDNTPLGTAFDAVPPPDIIYVVYASPLKLEPATYKDSWLGFRVGARDYLMRAMEILLNEIDITDTEGALKLNALKRHWEQLKPLLPAGHPSVQAIEAVLGPIRYARLIECRPETLLIQDGLKFVPDEIRRNYEHGKAVAAKLPREADVV